MKLQQRRLTGQHLFGAGTLRRQLLADQPHPLLGPIHRNRTRGHHVFHHAVGGINANQHLQAIRARIEQFQSWIGDRVFALGDIAGLLGRRGIAGLGIARRFGAFARFRIVRRRRRVSRIRYDRVFDLLVGPQAHRRKQTETENTEQQQRSNKPTSDVHGTSARRNVRCDPKVRFDRRSWSPR